MYYKKQASILLLLFILTYSTFGQRVWGKDSYCSKNNGQERVGQKVKIWSNGGIYTGLNKDTSLLWPSEEIREKSGKKAWGSFYPKTGDTGTIIHVFNYSEVHRVASATVIYLIDIKGFYVPIGCGYITNIDKMDEIEESEYFSIKDSILTQNYGYDSTYGKPLIVLTETNPWLMVIGSDIPTFAMYEKGQIIYKKIEKEHVKLYEIKLANEEIEQVIKSFSISDRFYKLDSEIVVSSRTDQPYNYLVLNLDSIKFVSVYGRLNGKEERKKMPKEFLTVYDNIKKYENSSAKEWQPQKTEVMFWDYSYAEKSKPWPDDFPDLDSPTSMKFKDGTYSVYVNWKSFKKFQNFYLSIEEKQAVEINGKKMAVSYRFIFPNLN